MLARAGLGDETLFPSAGSASPGHRVVNLVGAGVVQVFPLEVNLSAAGKPAEPLGQVERRGTADIVLQVVVELVLKVGSTWPSRTP